MKKFVKEWKTTIIFGLLILAVGVVLRLYNLTYLPIFADEAIYIRWAQVMRAEPTLRFLPLSDGKQPLFMWSIIPFLKIFSDPLFAGRFLSVLTGLGTTIGIFAFVYYLFKSKKAALIALFIYAISPFSVFFDRMALVDSMLTMFGVWTLFFFLVAVRFLRFDFAMLAGFALGGGLLTKSPALFFALLLPTTAILVDWPKKGKERLIRLAKLMALWLVTIVIGYGMFNILRLGPEFHMIALRNKDYVYPLSHLWTNPKDPFIFYLDRSLRWYWILGPSVLVLLTALGGVLSFIKKRKEGLLLLVWGLFPVFVQSEFAKVFTARYVLFSIPFLIILAASVSLAKDKIFAKLTTVGLIVFVFQVFNINRLILTDVESAPLPRGERSGYLEEWTAGTGIREIAEFIREEKMRKPDKGMVIGTEGFFGTLPDGLQIYLTDLTDVTVIGVGVSISDVHPSLLESKQAGNSTYLVVNSSRLKFDAEEAGLELIAAYPKAFRAENTHEYTQHGPRDTLYFFEVTEGALAPETGNL